MRFVAANLHPDHDTIAAFRRVNQAAFEAAFLQVLLLARESGLLRLGTVSIDGTKIDANASKIRSVRYDRAKDLRAKLAADIADLTAQAEAADADAQPDPQALPAETRQARGAEGQARCRLRAAGGASPRRGRGGPTGIRGQAGRLRGQEGAGAAGRPSRPMTPAADAAINLTDPDSALMRRSDAHEYRQAYNAQAVVCAEGSQLILATGVVATPADAPSFAATILGMEGGIGLPKTVLADTGFASGQAVAALEAQKIEPLVAIGRTQPHRPYDFRPPPEPRPARRITEPWRIAMLAKLETQDAKNLYARRKQTVEPVFGIIKAALGFTRFHLRGLANVTAEWPLIALAYNCRRLAILQRA